VHLSAEDGRYAEKLAGLAPYVCEAALARLRLMVEAEWYQALLIDVLPPACFEDSRALAMQMGQSMREIADQMPLSMANRIAEIEASTHHDVIAMITAFREELEKRLSSGEAAQQEKLSTLLAYIHLGLTSEDVTSMSHTLLLLNALDQVLVPAFDKLSAALRLKAQEFAGVPDPKNTGFSLGARYAAYGRELEEAARTVLRPSYLAVKFAGATGTHAALGMITREDADVLRVARAFVAMAAPRAKYLPVTAQINPHDDISLWCSALQALCHKTVEICAEIWEDSGLDVEVGGSLQKLLAVLPEKQQSGSSAMPQKVQVINIENAKGTALILKGLARQVAQEINLNRLQRELSDSRMMRELLGGMLPKLLQIFQNIASDVPKLVVNSQASKMPATSLRQSLPPQGRDPASDQDLRSALGRYVDAFDSAARRFAAIPFLARTHNQPASPTTFGKELKVFACRLRYLYGQLYTMDLNAVAVAAFNVLRQFEDDLRIYSTQRHGLVTFRAGELKFNEMPESAAEILERVISSAAPLISILERLSLDAAAAKRELDAHYESLGEALQTALRRYGVWDAYERVKKFARGAQMDREQYRAMVTAILADAEVAKKVPAAVRERLLSMSPADFCGEAVYLAQLELG
jgi:adenylosuccinate lyase